MSSHFKTSQSASFVRRRRRRTVKIISLVIVACVVFLVTGHYLSKVPFLKITEVQVYGAGGDIVQSLQDAAMKAISGSYLGIFDKSNALIYPRHGVGEALKNASPRVDHVSVGLSGLHEITVTISEKTPSAIVCPRLLDFDTGSSLMTDTDGCYLADSSGLIFALPKAFADQTYNKYYVPDMPSLSVGDQDVSSVIGLYATSTKKFIELQDFYNGAEKAGLLVEAILLKPKGEYEMYISNATSSDVAVIYFNDNKPLSEELSNLISFSNYAKQNYSKGKLQDLNSIDLRYGTNIFYR